MTACDSHGSFVIKSGKVKSESEDMRRKLGIYSKTLYHAQSHVDIPMHFVF